MGGGIGSIIIGLILWLVFGMNPMTAMQTGSAITGGNSSGQQTLDQQTADRDQKFASVVLKDTEEVWGQIFSENNMQYQQPKLVLFNGMVRSGCGNASQRQGLFIVLLTNASILIPVFSKKCAKNWVSQVTKMAQVMHKTKVKQVTLHRLM